MTDFEQQLRERLHATAEQVQPNPETWTRVQEGIRRAHRFRWLYAGASAAALAAVAAVAVVVIPGLLDPRVGFEPGGDVAGQPTDPGVATDVEPGPGGVGTAVPPPVDMVLATGDGLVRLAPGGVGAMSGPADGVASSVAVRPGSIVDDLDLVWAGTCALGRLRSDPNGDVASAIEPLTDGACPAGPRFSPDGDHLAWIEETEDGIALASVGWDDGGEVRARNATWQLDLEQAGPAGLRDLRIVDWVWTGVEGASASGFLAFAASGADGTTHVLTLPFDRHADGALALPSGDAPAIFETDPHRLVAFARDTCLDGQHCPDGVTWTLRVDEEGVLGLYREDAGEEIATLTHDVLDGIDPDAGPVWLEASGDVVVFGDGLGGAWSVHRTDDGWSEVEPLPGGQVLAGAIIAGIQQPPASAPAPQATEEPAATEEPEPVETVEPTGLPAAVASTRARIQDAAAARDLEALAAIGTGHDGTFTFSYGGGGDPVEFWRLEMENGFDVPAIILDLLAHEPAARADGDPVIYQWPAGSDLPYEQLSSAQVEALTAQLGQDEMDRWQASGSYLGYRVGIDAEGRWLYVVAGD
jgi:hypothetical protein